MRLLSCNFVATNRNPIHPIAGKSTNPQIRLNRTPEGAMAFLKKTSRNSSHEDRLNELSGSLRAVHLKNSNNSRTNLEDEAVQEPQRDAEDWEARASEEEPRSFHSDTGSQSMNSSSEYKILQLSNLSKSTASYDIHKAFGLTQESMRIEWKHDAMALLHFKDGDSGKTCNHSGEL